MQITVYFSADAEKCAQLDVEPTETVKSVKQRVIALYPPPDWSNAALLAFKGKQDYLENRKRLKECKVVSGSVLKFVYARNLTVKEKIKLNMNGIETEEFDVPPALFDTYPISPVPA
mmetsp:Transcript_21546/g.67518  ORF Transcript_21546/g.67518 Transcript_21546/m.67518 type:complete len:117 (+) Transcript_21546:64-414(+)